MVLGVKFLFLLFLFFDFLVVGGGVFKRLWICLGNLGIGRGGSMGDVLLLVVEVFERVGDDVIDGGG